MRRRALISWFVRSAMKCCGLFAIFSALYYSDSNEAQGVHLAGLLAKT